MEQAILRVGKTVTGALLDTLALLGLEYLASLIVHDLLVVELSLGLLPYQVLIGRDVLDACRFLYDGPHKRFRLGY